MSDPNILFNERGQLRHLISLDALSTETILHILDIAQSMFDTSSQTIKKMPLLRGITVVNLFFEPSTRTRTSFEIAAKRLSADYLNINVATSATNKGESLLDTIYTLQAMQTDMFIVRHSASGAANYIASHVAPHVSVINAGDGSHAHPTQALLDLYTIRHFKQKFSSLAVAIVGDIAHSRVARSQIQGLHAVGVTDIRAIGPQAFVPEELQQLGVKIFHHLEEGMKDVDVVITLRMQRERFDKLVAPSMEQYFEQYGLTNERLQLAKPDAIVMHPGPMNRGVEIASDVADGPQSVILQQVTFGIVVRMAVMAYLIGNRYEEKA